MQILKFYSIVKASTEIMWGGGGQLTSKTPDLWVAV